MLAILAVAVTWFYLGLTIGSTINGGGRFHIHQYCNWEPTHRLKIRDEFGGQRTYQVWTGTCRVCGRPKTKKCK